METDKASKIIKLIKTTKKNIKFIKERIEKQNEDGYEPKTYLGGHERQYSNLDLIEQEEKLKIFKSKLK